MMQYGCVARADYCEELNLQLPRRHVHHGCIHVLAFSAETIASSYRSGSTARAAIMLAYLSFYCSHAYLLDIEGRVIT